MREMKIEEGEREESRVRSGITTNVVKRERIAASGLLPDVSNIIIYK